MSINYNLCHVFRFISIESSRITLQTIFMQITYRCNFPDISYISETQKNNFQFLSYRKFKANFSTNHGKEEMKFLICFSMDYLEIITWPLSRTRHIGPVSTYLPEGLPSGKYVLTGPICLVPRQWPCCKLFITCF